MPPFHVPAAQDARYCCIRGFDMGAGERFRHGAVPGELRFDEAFEL